MLLETLVEVEHADNAVGHREQNEENGDGGKGCQGPPDSLVVLLPLGVRRVNTGKLIDEIGKTTNVEDKDTTHSPFVLPSGEECGGNKNEDGNRNGDDRQGEFDILCIRNNDNELNDESKEEEEIELEKSDVDL